MHSFIQTYFNFIKRFIPKPIPVPAVGLDISADSAKLVEIKKTEDAYELVNVALEPVEGKGIRSAFEKILAKKKTPGKSIFTSVYGQGTLIRYLEVPRMSVEDLKRSFSIESDRYFPFPSEQIYTDCHILSPQDKNKTMRIVAAAVKKELIEERIKLLTEFGLQADFVGINAAALINAFQVLGEDLSQKKDSAVALLDIGESVGNLNIFSCNIPLFTRDIFIGGRDFTKRLSLSLAIGIEEAEQIKRNSNGHGQKFIDFCEAEITTLTQEIRLSFDYFTTERNIEITHLFLVGGGSLLVGLAEALQRNLDIPTSLWDPLGHLKIVSDFSGDQFKNQSMRLGVAAGLALSGL